MSEGSSDPSVTLPSKATQGQEEWRVVSASAKRRKVFRAPDRMEKMNSFSVLELGEGKSAEENDLCKVRSEELFRKFKEALAKIKNWGAPLWYAVCCRGGDWEVNGCP
ncbi:hypothetical protein E2C01_039063 [Portunus trituberculatus]|uniref:Uncharacterized protein n=1 Tax=Portunus trituberculatus TaxID=210409 RepID=A0A5B7FIM4_PORTR|nr:hypothetical protein [Portunus trituberculatus]